MKTPVSYLVKVLPEWDSLPQMAGQLITADVIFAETIQKPWDMSKHIKYCDGNNVVSDTALEPLNLVLDGCHQPDGSVNCITSCSKPESMFDGFSTIWNCLILASLSLSMAEYPKTCRNLTSQLEPAMSAMGVPSLLDFDGYSSLNRISICANASCFADSGSCYIPTLGYDKSLRSQDLDLGRVAMSLSSVCVESNSVFNADIAGPGVLVTYIMQAILALYVLLLARYFTFYRTKINISHPLEAKDRQFPRIGSELSKLDQSNPKLSGQLRKINKSRLFQATVPFIAEFQEAQCFFVIATSIAFLFAIYRPVTFGGAENWGSIQINSRNIEAYGMAGGTSLVITQVALGRLRKEYVYSHVLLMIATLMATIVAFRADVPFMGDFKGQTSLPQCGGSPSLRTFCFSEADYGRRSQDGGRTALRVLWIFSVYWFWFITYYPFVKKIIVTFLKSRDWPALRKLQTLQERWFDKIKTLQKGIVEFRRKTIEFVENSIDLIAELFQLELKKGDQVRQEEEEARTRQEEEARTGVEEEARIETEWEKNKRLKKQARERWERISKALKSATKAFEYFSLRLIEFLGALYLLYTMYILIAQVKTRGAASIIGLNIDSNNDSQRLSWNMGQVVAVLVWVPVLSKYLYAIFFGLEKVFELRLPDEFTVQKKPEVKENVQLMSTADVGEERRAIVATSSAPVNSGGMWERQPVNTRHTD